MKGCNGFSAKNIEQIINYENGIHELRDKALNIVTPIVDKWKNNFPNDLDDLKILGIDKAFTIDGITYPGFYFKNNIYLPRSGVATWDFKISHEFGHHVFYKHITPIIESNLDYKQRERFANAIGYYYEAILDKKKRKDSINEAHKQFKDFLIKIKQDFGKEKYNEIKQWVSSYLQFPLSKLQALFGYIFWLNKGYQT